MMAEEGFMVDGETRSVRETLPFVMAEEGLVVDGETRSVRERLYHS